MPSQDGLAVLEFLKKNPDWSIIPTVVWSGSNNEDDIKKAYMLGASSYHVKPSNGEGLFRVIRASHSNGHFARCRTRMLPGGGFTHSTQVELEIDTRKMAMTGHLQK